MKRISIIALVLFCTIALASSLYAGDKPECLYAPTSTSWVHNMTANGADTDTNWCSGTVDLREWDVNRLRLLMKWTQHQCDSVTRYQICRSIDGIVWHATSFSDTVYSAAGAKDNTAAQVSLLIVRDSCFRFMRARAIMKSEADDSGSFNEVYNIWEGWKSP